MCVNLNYLGFSSNSPGRLSQARTTSYPARPRSGLGDQVLLPNPGLSRSSFTSTNLTMVVSFILTGDQFYFYMNGSAALFINERNNFL
jgi:hypothetical protein